MSANAAAAAVRHRKELAEAVARTKAKARLRRLVAAVPFVGAGAIVYFEDHGPVAVWCRSFDSILCSKGDELWAQQERMNFAKTRCELH